MPRNAISRKRKKTTSFSAYEITGGTAYIFFICCASGVAPFTFRRTRGLRWNVAPSVPVHVYSWAVSSILSMATVWGGYNEVKYLAVAETGFNGLQTFVLIVDDLVLLLLPFIALLSAPKRVRSVINLFTTLTKIDAVLGEKKFKDMEIRSLPIYIGATIFAVMLLGWDFRRQRDDADSHLMDVFQDYFAYYVQYLVMVGMEMHFIVLANAIQKRYHALADELDKEKLRTRRFCEFRKKKVNSSFISEFYYLSPDKRRAVEVNDKTNNYFDKDYGSNSSDVDTSHKVTRHQRVCNLTNLRLELSLTIKEISEGFGHIMLIILISALVHMVDIPYFLMIDIVIEDDLPFSSIFQQVMFLAWTVVRLVCIVEPCHQCIRAESRITSSVCYMLEDDDDVLVRQELKKLWKQLVGKPSSAATFTVLNICELKRSLITALSATVTTYLVILIQFQYQ